MKYVVYWNTIRGNTVVVEARSKEEAIGKVKEGDISQDSIDIGKSCADNSSYDADKLESDKKE